MLTSFKLIAELDEHIIWFGAGPPDVDTEKYKFWWDTEALELLINYNDQWFPVAIPPAQVEALRATIDGIMDDVTRVKADIILNKADIDGNSCWMSTNRIDEANFEIMKHLSQVLMSGSFIWQRLVVTLMVMETFTVKVIIHA